MLFVRVIPSINKDRVKIKEVMFKNAENFWS